MEEILYRYNPWWEERQLFEGTIERPAPMETIKEYLRSRQIVFLTGLRRVGKTTLLKLLIKHLIEQLKNLYDSQKVKIYASSSSSSILKSKKPYLTGRSAVIEILPLDFKLLNLRNYIFGYR